MTNYINTITLNQETYPIGPYKIDDYGNTVQYGVSLVSNFQSNILFTGSLSYSDTIANSESSVTNMIVIGPSVKATHSSSSQIWIGNDNFKIGMTSDSAIIGNGVAITGVSRGAVMAGGFTAGYVMRSTPGFIDVDIPATVYAVGKAWFGNDYFEVGNYTYISYSNNSSSISMDGTSIGDYYCMIPLLPITGNEYLPTVGFKISERTTNVYKPYLDVISSTAGGGIITATSFSLTIYTNTFVPYTSQCSWMPFSMTIDT